MRPGAPARPLRGQCAGAAIWPTGRLLSYRVCQRGRHAWAHSIHHNIMQELRMRRPCYCTQAACPRSFVARILSYHRIRALRAFRPHSDPCLRRWRPCGARRGTLNSECPPAALATGITDVQLCRLIRSTGTATRRRRTQRSRGNQHLRRFVDRRRQITFSTPPRGTPAHAVMRTPPGTLQWTHALPAG
jgi:hypothetical protein